MSDGAFLVPQTVFVGDEGRLVLPLTGMPSTDLANIVITEHLPFNENIMVKRVEIDVRAKQLLLDFTAFRPGIVEIPPIIEGLDLPPLKVEIASILEREGYSITLSPPEKPLAAPGTFALISGGAAACIALAAAVVFAVRYGPKHFHLLFEKVRVRLLIYKTKRAILRTQTALAGGRIGIKEGVTRVGEVFKAFLSALYRKDYASYAAEDFLAEAAGDAAYRIFAACDTIRFSKAAVEPAAAQTLVEKALSCVEGWAA
jgi:hypothetical protein